MLFDVERVDPYGLSDRDIDGYCALVAASFPIDQPYSQLPARAAMIENIRPEVPAAENSIWFARWETRVIGYAKVEPLTGVNASIVQIMVRVHPEFRRRGVGTALMRGCSVHLGDGGRTKVTGAADEGSPGEAWANALGFEVTAGYRKQRLDVPIADQKLWDVPQVPGFVLRGWSREAPEELLAAYALARNAIHDRPKTDSYDAPRWTADEIRDDEREQRELGIERHVLAAVEEHTGMVAGLTIMEFLPARPELGMQRDTAVLERYRGKGLGLWLKATMLTHLTRDRGDLATVITSTSRENTHMARINTALGFSEPATLLVFEQSIESAVVRVLS
ncbi:N-acetyltransferase [Actinorhabdospora filicis]|uniref:N-acetyltransferase n=1 Tax=Actinorhabdospora filicis TaxID=1785913 RepID=A0A9W6SKH1_9ACTN|nr:GNAT family N-acetyltransferase [Actinorhabdospora filicis]GLZ77477.1 N-acetyltransferase [Actinorhabdospora filicis]